MAPKPTEPRWVTPFLRALERTGEARAAAKDAGIDHSTAHARRRAHGEFAERWSGALTAHAEAKRLAEEEEIAAIARDASAIASSGNGPPPRSGEDLVVSGGKVRRAGAERWSRRKERIFFEELAATANATMAAEAAGVSPNAVFARRLKHPVFAAKWEAVVRTSKASIDLYLVEETRKSFDPAKLDTAEVKPRVTIDQAIKISQLNARKQKEEELPPDPFVEEAAAMDADGIAEVRERIIGKLRRIRERDRREQLAAGWTLDESYDVMIPPGYARTADYVPKEPEEPVDFAARYQ